MRVLTASQVHDLFPMATAIDAMAEAVVASSRGNATVPPRHQLLLASPAAEMLVMPGAIHDPALLGAKLWWRLEPDGHPARTDALVLLVDPSTGDEVLLDGSVITDVRTGALTGLAARHLADPATTTALVVGAGRQARTQALALADVLPQLRTIQVSSRTPHRRAAFVERLAAELGAHSRVAVREAPDVAAAASGAGVIVTATTSPEPVVGDEAIAPGTLVCGVGSHDRDSAEIHPETLGRASLVVVDSPAATSVGDIAAPLESGALDPARIAQLGDVLSSSRPVRPPEGITVFKSVGFAAADLVAAQTITRAARDRGLGMYLDMHDDARKEGA